jgi:hypothetical protein
MTHDEALALYHPIRASVRPHPECSVPVRNRTTGASRLSSVNACDARTPSCAEQKKRLSDGVSKRPASHRRLAFLKFGGLVILHDVFAFSVNSPSCM